MTFSVIRKEFGRHFEHINCIRMMENVLQSSRCSSKRSEKSLQQKITVNAHHLSCGAHSKSIRNNFVHVSEMYKSVIINKTKIRRKKVVTSLELGFSVVDGILVFCGSGSF